MIPQSYQHAIDSGVYLSGVDTSRVGDRRPVSRGEIGEPIALFIIGQSNGGNHGATPFAAAEAVFNFNLFDGLCYRACDPLLGATGEGGSPWCLLGDALIRDGFAESVLLCPLNVGGATVGEWAPGGPYSHRMSYGLARLREAGFEPSHVLWHQGEADALYGTSGESYVRSLQALVGSLRDLHITAPIHVAIASFFAEPAGYSAAQSVIRAAQHAVIDPGHGIFLGPDTDLIMDRFDGCHLGRRGLMDHARAWQVILTRARERDAAVLPPARD
jgi:Carbohydrate esterase, sialic acid-specific acetylesterase